MTASTYPVKLIENLQKEIEDLKAENKRLQGRVDYYLRQQERLRYPRVYKPNKSFSIDI